MPSQSLIDAVSSPINAPVDPWWTSSAPPLVFTFQMTDPGALGSANLSAESGYSPLFTFNDAQKGAIRSVLAEVSQLINVNFVEVSGASDPDFNFGKVNFPASQAGQGGFWYNYNINQNGVAFNKIWDGYALWDNDWLFNSQNGRALLLHEIGHSLSLKHPGNYDVTGASPPGPFLPPEYDNNKYTVMSYTDNPDNGLPSDHYMPFDILALQQRWGANMQYRTGNDVYSGPRDGRIDTIWDAGGNDTIDGSAQFSSVRIDLNEGAFSSLGAVDNLAIAYNAVIENAAGGGFNDNLVGNAAANLLGGRDGNDSIFGGDGNDNVFGDGGDDYIDGNAGNDYLVGGVGNDAVTAGDGNDFLAGQDGNDRMFGWVGDDTIYGDGGDDYIDGNWGNDYLVGGAGNDAVTAGDGNDFLAGQDGDDSMFGWFGDDMLYGDAGNDWLSGDEGNDMIAGGAGSDQLFGGGGFDRFAFFSTSESRFGAGDSIRDFFAGGGGIGGDIVDVSGIDANVNQAGDQAFQFVGVQNSPSGIGTLQVGTIQGVGTFLFGYTDANGDADLIIDIGLAGLSMRADNFWL